MSNFYQILEVHVNATTAEIKKQYRKLCKLYHADLNNGDKEKEEMMKLLNEAYACLSDAELRKVYDKKLFPQPDINAGPSPVPDNVPAKRPHFNWQQVAVAATAIVVVVIAVIYIVKNSNKA